MFMQDVLHTGILFYCHLPCSFVQVGPKSRQISLYFVFKLFVSHGRVYHTFADVVRQYSIGIGDWSLVTLPSASEGIFDVDALDLGKMLGYVGMMQSEIPEKLVTRDGLTI